MTLQTAIIAALASLPPRRSRATVERDVAMRARDGAVLLADVWLPAEDDPHRPAVLVRTPYNRRGLDAIARLVAEQGHPVVVQNCRGTFGSTGAFVPFRDDAADGEDTIAWLTGLPWARHGRPLALIGASYLGFTAYALARSTRVQSLTLGVTATDFHRTVLYPDGVLAAESALIWIHDLLAQERPPMRRLLAGSRVRRRMPEALLERPESADVAVVDAPYRPYRDWVAHPRLDDPWWEPLDQTSVRADLPPSTQVAGWYDPFLVGQLADHAALVASGRPTRLVVGPWTHGSPGLLRTFLREAVRTLADPADATGIAVFDQGARRWALPPVWPPASTIRSLALGADGVLTPRIRATAPALETTWTARPADPPPAAGGRGLNPAFAGRRPQRHRETRADVQVFSTGRLRRPVTIAGAPSVRLRVDGLDAEQDWFVRLCDVDRFGVSRNLCDGFLRLAPDHSGRRREIAVPLAPTAHTFRVGHRIRLQIAGSGFPLHPRAGSEPDAVHRLSSTAAQPSALDLPVLAGGWSGAQATVQRGRP